MQRWAVISGQCGEIIRYLLEIVDDDAGAVGLEDFFDEFDVQQVGLVVVLRFLIGKSDVERDL